MIMAGEGEDNRRGIVLDFYENFLKKMESRIVGENWEDNG